MRFDFVPTALVTAINAVLAADSTLQGASYLNGTNKFFTGRFPNDKVLPCLLTQASEFPQSGSQFIGTIRIFCQASLMSNGQIDPLGDLILARVEELLSNGVVTVTGMTVQPMESLGIVPSFLDQESNKSEQRGVVRFRVTLGYNT